MSSLFDGILKNLSTSRVVVLINLGLFQVSMNSCREIPSLPLDDLCYHRQSPLTPCQYKLAKYIWLYFFLGKDIHLILVYHHISLSIGLFNLSYEVTHLSSDNSLLM